MENKETPKARRPLPTPGAIPAQRPNTPVPGALNASAVAPTNFYATTKTPAPPTRRSTIGTSYTTYIPPEDPPAYVPSYATPGFREPELVTEDTMESLPELTPSNSWDEKGESWDDNTWSSAPAPWGQYSYQSTSTNAWSNNVSDDFNFDTTDYLSSASKPLVDVVIEGRDTYEENHWWDPAVREKAQRPGPGMLPPVLAEELHDPEHSLFSVSVTSPDIRVPNPPAASTSSTDQTDQPPTSSPPRSLWGSSPPPSTPVPPSSPSTSISGPSPPPPSEEDVRTAVPHPNAYYCPKENGWVILSWKSSSVAPPLAKSFENSSHHPLPDQARRRRTESCIGDEQPFGRANKTHHFHKYEKAVDSHKLTPPFRREEWETMETVKQRRRTGTIMEDIDIKQIDPQDIDMMDETMPEEEEGRLLDLYVCCQCSFYCVASGVIPGVIPRKCFDEFVRDKKNNPQPGKSGEQGIVVAFETIIMIIENKLWKGENRLLRLTRTSFQNKVGWNTNIKRVFDVLGFVETLLDSESALKPPATDVATAEGRMNRRKLLRAWVEVSAWVADFKRIHAAHFKDSPKLHKLYVQIESAREMYQTAIGAHPDQIARGELSGSLLAALQPLHKEWESLGLTPMSYSSDLLAFGYYAQCRCDPAGTVNYFTHFSNIVGLMQNFPGCPQSLPEILATERSRDRFTSEDLVKAASVLGFGPEGPLGVDYDDEIPENFIENAWRECVKKSWRDPEHGSENLRFANEAFRVLAEARGSESLRKIWEAGKDRVMNPERAYDTLEVPKDVDDFMLITVYNMRMDEALSQTDKMREAMTVIAEVRDSERLRQFLDTGRDPGDIVAPIRPDLPRGLNQLGNTCYLNSLLQYFYTIKDLREAVMPMSKLDLKSLEDEKLSDDDLKRHRVGGRLVTRREILRSKKFINQLADLFFNLEYCETAAVTPTIELAKLALVTSRDEEEDEADKGGTDSSNDTDATLVDDVPPRVTMSEVPQSPARSPNSVLGKRARDVERHPSAMDLDSSAPASPNPDTFVSTPSPRTSSSPPPLQSPGSSTIQPEASGSGSLSQIEVDVEMRATPAPGSKPPPLPPRKPVETSDSVMMFGKQHDVAECMDNCMFQIETALLKFDGLNEAQGESSDKTSVVKRLFYGRLRQRLTGNLPSGSSVHEKEDLFSHLPVNVTDDGVDIYDGLSGYFDDVVDFDGEKRRMEVTLIDLPPVLQIQLQRVQFNRETLQPYKSQAYVKFGETIYMDRFMDNADPQKKAQSKVIQTELNACRDRIRLVEGKDGPYVSALENTTSFLSKVSELAVDVDDDLLYQLNDEQVVLKTEIDELRARADRLKDELEAIWRDNTEIAYELTSVFIHRGSSPSWGHYFFYSRHLPDHPDSWFKYNDSDVTVVSKDEVLADTTGSTANPYLLVFARKGSEVVDTVKRFDATMIDML
ncbi:putative ubiquitin carboxyl-terminal hydrolase 2 [Hypsizygus marmoreus]|uniref:ubiquitinyl hydrolase 1 n=1 Tax=Hypsizygus marmoreus TaxID=39966 RepID=A0A369JIT8_HYPMA|nr:putative ubiquitin carboxyl-terminal hydrolase 2 [Hypsizygus marmoreus]